MKDADRDESVQYYSEKEIEDKSHLTGGAEQMVDRVMLTDWMTENAQTRGVKLEFVTNKSPEGGQFVMKGLGGIGSLLRFQRSFEGIVNVNEEDAGFDSDFDDFENIV